MSLTVPIGREGVLHFLGYRGRGAPGPRIEELLGPALEEARALAVPRGVHLRAAPESVSTLGLEARAGSDLVLGLVTIGPALEQRVSSLLAEGEATRALLLDAAGSAAAEESAGALERLIHAGPTLMRFSPGYGSWPVTAQHALFELLPHREIGVRLLPSGLMEPRKSVSFAVWLGIDGEVVAGEEHRAGRCDTCGMMECPYRFSTPVSGEDSITGEDP